MSPFALVSLLFVIMFYPFWDALTDQVGFEPNDPTEEFFL